MKKTKKIQSPLKHIAIIGNPIKHSLSPAMHNAAFQRLKMSCEYHAIRVRPEELNAFIKEVRASRECTTDCCEGANFVGFNVTIPHKEKIIKYLDKISPEAEAIGAVNTVVISGSELFGYNTDAAGYLQSLKTEMKFQPRGKTVVILGAGGAARAVLFALAESEIAEVVIANRTLQRAQKLVREFQKKFAKIQMRAISLDSEKLKEVLPKAQLVINATSMGLQGSHWNDFPFSKISKKAIMSDLVYRPLKTQFLQKSEKAGLKIHSGLGMLLYQGVLGFQLWTQKKPDISAMKKALLDALS